MSTVDVEALSQDINLARLSPAGFAMYASKGLWKPAKHLAYLNNLLIKAANREIRRIIVTMPPRHGKSELISKYLPTWVVGALQERVIVVSHEHKFARSWGQAALELYQEYGAEVFGSPLSSKNASWEQWASTDGGIMYTRGVGGQLTGLGCNWLILDDIVKNSEEAQSNAFKDSIWDWYRSTARTRLQPGGVIIMMMTRWDEQDLIGQVLEQDSSLWTIVDFPSIAKEHDILGRRPGDPLWPEGGWNLEALLEAKAELGDDWFNSMYQCEPVRPGGNRIKHEWWRYWDDIPPFERIVVSWDTASTNKDYSSYSVAAVWGLYEDNFYLIELKRDKVEFPTLVEWAQELSEKYPGCTHVIEEASNGKPLVDTLRRDLRGSFIYPVKVATDKGARLSAVINAIGTGRCYLPRQATWLRAFLEEHRRFPYAEFTDQVDTTTMVLQYYLRWSRPPKGVSSIGSAKRDASLFYDDITGYPFNSPKENDV